MTPHSPRRNTPFKLSFKPLFVLLAICAPALASMATTIHAATITVDIKNVGDKGDVVVGLYRKNDKWLGKPAFGTMAAAKGNVSVSFKDIAEGEYAISVYVDENSNGKMDSNAIKIPTEPYAFSNDAVGNFDPPTFEQAKFIVAKENKSLVITIQ